MNPQTLRAHMSKPSTEQGSGFFLQWKHPTGRADERLHAERRRPLAQRLGIKRIQPPRHPIASLEKNLIKQRTRHRMREVQPANTRQQKLPPNRPLRIKQIDGEPSFQQLLCGDQTRRTAADNGNLRVDRTFSIGTNIGHCCIVTANALN